MRSAELKTLCLLPDASLLEAMRVIDRGGLQIALIVNNEGLLLGVLTDGDIRRALLRHSNLEASVDSAYTRRFRSVSASVDRAAALDMIVAYRIDHLPVVDPRGHLIGLHTLSDLVGGKPRANWAVIMAGGKGTRLGELTRTTPKPMLKVAGRPILERIVLHLVGAGFRNIFLAIQYLGDQIEAHFGDGSNFGCKIDYLREKEPLGSGGALKLLPSPPTLPVLVINGDLVTEFHPDEMLRQHEELSSTITIGTRTYTHAVPFGCLDLDANRVTGLREKPLMEETINAGIYILNPEVIGRAPQESFPITDLILDSIQRGEEVRAFPVGEWIDVGRPVDLDRAQGLLPPS